MRNHDIHQSAPFLATACDERLVGRRNEHKRNESDVLRESLIRLFVALQLLLLSAFHAAVDRHRLVLIGSIRSVEHKKVGVVLYHLRVDRIERTAAERQVVDSIEQIGLALAIAAEKTVELGRELKRSLPDILEVEYG